MKATKKHLVGRTIVDVDPGPFSNGKGGTAHDPTLTLDDGRKVFFVVEETEVGKYGISLCISTRPNRRRTS
jgi:hypothetical protein